MKTIRFDLANRLTWESTTDGPSSITIDDDTQQATDDMSDIACVVDEVIDGWSRDISEYAGDVHGAMGPVGLYIYTMEDDDWIYVAHMIREVEYQCFLFRHRKCTRSKV
tara:strand:+ start:274 stop:600 length:327 start_codon:yes stop_codon:yes gene_type:complete